MVGDGRDPQAERGPPPYSGRARRVPLNCQILPVPAPAMTVAFTVLFASAVYE